MTITKIKRIGNSNQFHVFVDDNFAGIFLDEILVKFNFKTGGEIEEETFFAIKLENDEKVAFDMAVSYVERYVVSQKGLAEYLKRKNFSPNTISNVLKKLQEYQLLNDERFAKNCFESMTASHGKRAIAQKLKAKGVADEIVEDLISSVCEDDEIERATTLAEKFAKNREKNTKNKQKCVAHLVRRGYDYSVAQKATNEIFKNTGDEDDWI